MGVPFGSQEFGFERFHELPKVLAEHRDYSRPKLGEEVRIVDLVGFENLRRGEPTTNYLSPVSLFPA
ncbi:MAG TPA: hypothetical protein PKE55_13740 [Kiritimatiellia bacterium]|nr:hypothetical protein [Kiritimatiellia bacterium]